jgi:sialidase-1
MTRLFSSSMHLTVLFILVSLFTAMAYAEFESVAVFENGEEGYNNYRIPAVIVAANGDVLAFCEARDGGDLSEIDLVLKRSADGGKTWGPIEVVQGSDRFRSLFGKDKKEISVGNPAPVVDLLDAEHPGRIWLPYTLENDRVFVTYSDDHGKTWGKRREITADVKRKIWGWYATGPVHSIQMQGGKHKGRLVIPCDHRLGEGGNDRGALGAHAILSDDHGKTWRLGAIDDTYDDGLNANETTVVELGDGRLYFNTRDQNGKAKGTRGGAYSSDAGESFDHSPHESFAYFQPSAEQLDPPVVQCSLLRAASTASGDERDLILFSGPDENGPTGKGRSDLRIRYTTDETVTWHDGPLIHEGPAAYSDMIRLAKGHYGVLFEAGKKGNKRYDQIVFVRLTNENIIREAARDSPE